MKYSSSHSNMLILPLRLGGVSSLPQGSQKGREAEPPVTPQLSGPGSSPTEVRRHLLSKFPIPLALRIFLCSVSLPLPALSILQLRAGRI